MTKLTILLLSLIALVLFAESKYLGSFATKPFQPNVVTIGFTGDLMLGRLMNHVIKQNGYKYPWGNLLPLLQKTDLTIANLETTLTRATEAVPKVFNFKSAPENVHVLKKAGIDVVSLANNHIKDFGNKGLLETIDVLNAGDITHVGAGKNIHKAEKPVIIQKKGITIGIIGATDNEPTWKAGPDTPGTNYFDVTDVSKLVEQIKKLKKEVDVVIVSLHWGPNMREHPTQEYIDAAHKLVDAGADIIHGHSAHIFQGVQQYKNALIMYDTGDFIDDYRVDPILRNDRSFLFVVELDKTGVKKLTLLPVRIDTGQVNMAIGQDAQWSLERMRRLSKEFGTSVSKDGVWQCK